MCCNVLVHLPYLTIRARGVNFWHRSARCTRLALGAAAKPLRADQAGQRHHVCEAGLVPHTQRGIRNIPLLLPPPSAEGVFGQNFERFLATGVEIVKSVGTTGCGRLLRTLKSNCIGAMGCEAGPCSGKCAVALAKARLQRGARAGGWVGCMLPLP